MVPDSRIDLFRTFLGRCCFCHVLADVAYNIVRASVAGSCFEQSISKSDSALKTEYGILKLCQQTNAVVDLKRLFTQ